MASPRTRKRKQQRLVAKVRRAEQLRWSHLTREQKKAENPSALWLEDCSETIRNYYASYLAEMVSNDFALHRLLSEDTRRHVEGKPYTYAIRTNAK